MCDAHHNYKALALWLYDENPAVAETVISQVDCGYAPGPYPPYVWGFLNLLAEVHDDLVRCYHCGKYRHSHAGKWCLYTFTKYEPECAQL